MDAAWWRVYGIDAEARFAGYMCSAQPAGGLPVEQIPADYGNSGAMAIHMAAHSGRIILLGYDGQKTNGMTHWHGSHTSGLGDAAGMHKWQGQFDAIPAAVRMKTINCSRKTSLTGIRRGVLEEELCQS